MVVGVCVCVCGSPPPWLLVNCGSLSSQENSVISLGSMFTKKNSSTNFVRFSTGICRESTQFLCGKVVFPRLNDVTLSS